ATFTANYPGGVVVDGDLGKIFYTQDYKLVQADLDGNNKSDFITGLSDGPGAVTMDTENDILYWLGATGNYALYSAPVNNTSAVSTLISPYAAYYNAMVLFMPAETTVSTPTVDTPTSADVDTNSATLGGTVANTGGANISERGIYWSTSAGFTPPAQGTKVAESGDWGTGAFTVSVSSLPENTPIYFQAFATNSAGSSFSSQALFTTTAGIIESTQPYTSITGKKGTLHAVGGYLSTITVNNTPSGLPRGVKMPLGQLSFTITGTTPGATIPLNLYADSSLRVSSYYKRNRLTNAWVNIAENVAVADGTTTRIDFSLTDGGPYDADGVANGTIVDPGGAGEILLTPLVRENTLLVAALEPLSDTQTIGAPSYAVTGGADASRFEVDANSGLLRFINAPDYENPGTTNTDIHGRPVYTVEVTIDGATAGQDLLTLAVSLLDDTESDGVILDLAGDYTEFTPGGAAEYIDYDPDLATVGNGSSDSFANGVLTITQMSGPTDGSFSFDAATAFAGDDDQIGAGEDVKTNNSLPNAIGTIDNSADGQLGNALVIHFNGTADAGHVGEILNGLL
ncbi:MAG: hypothetical protein KDE31_32965, partial [Caldilineaceae bacterium]|nr:hypothetical protein [Caldilineaceae bacterium]